jgi:hypothetical protein
MRLRHIGHASFEMHLILEPGFNSIGPLDLRWIFISKEIFQ